MSTNDNSDKESDYEDQSPKIPKVSLSSVGFRSNTDDHNAKPLRETQSFGDIERLCGNFQWMNIWSTVTSVPKPTAVCPCGCLLRPATTAPFRTREKSTLALHVVSPEVLSYHGHCFEPCQIAMFWKKDCRKFLWKGQANMKNPISVETHNK